jgi:hypothetical protein
VLAGDFLLSVVARLVASTAPQASWAFADWLAELTRLRVLRLSGGGAAVDLFATLFEFPARIGAWLAGARWPPYERWAFMPAGRSSTPRTCSR